MQIVNHRLDTAEWVPAADVREEITPEAIVIHFTAGGKASGSIAWLTKQDDNYVSSHLVIDRNGHVFQLAQFNLRALHAGVSEWNGRTDLNSWSIGIELANWGLLTANHDGGFVSWSGQPVAAANAREATHKNGLSGWWEVFSGLQTDSLVQVCRTLVATYGIRIIVGHDDVAPARKNDPGPLLDMTELRALVFANDEPSIYRTECERCLAETYDELTTAINTVIGSVAVRRKGGA